MNVQITFRETRGPLTVQAHRIGVAVAFAAGLIGSLLPLWSASSFLGSFWMAAITGDGKFVVGLLGLSAVCQLVVLGAWQRTLGRLSAVVATLVAADFVRRYYMVLSDVPDFAVLTLGPGAPAMIVGGLAMTCMAWMDR